MARRKRERTIFFPWERRRGALNFPLLRSRILMAAVGMIVVLTLFGIRERNRIGIRSTRATMLVVRQSIDDYRADNDRRCPPSLQALVDENYLTIEPRDAWGRPLVLTCPGRRNTEGYDLISYGESGDMRGLDRIE